jgi:hypothetical protein
MRRWLALVGEERFEEIEHPEAALGGREGGLPGQRDTTTTGLRPGSEAM